MHVLHLNLRLKGLDKKAVHLIPFETRNLQHSPLERGLQLFQARLVLKLARKSSYGRIKAQMAAAMKYSGI